MSRASRAARIAVVSLPLLAACAGTTTGGGGPQPLGVYPPRDLQSRHPLTRPERTNYAETSTHADVIAFLDSLKSVSPDIYLGSFGQTSQGRNIPLVILSRPLVHSAAEAKRLNRPIIYLQGNIHGGEVEGKDALLALLRDLAIDKFQNVVDSLVIVAVPIYNADGNDAFGPQERNRTEQNGPASVGLRANGQGLDLNRDYVKAEAPETRASLAFFRAWDPDVFVDLHTTDGSFHGYALTWAPPLNPAARFSGPFTRDTLLPLLRDELKKNEHIETFPYGNFVAQDSVQRGWFTYDHRPRFGTNYYGLRGRVAILSEAYSHDPLRKRIASTYGFVMELLSLVAGNAADIMEIGNDADRHTIELGSVAGASAPIALRSEMTTHPRLDAVLVEELAPSDTSHEPGVPAGMRRTGRVQAIRIPVYDRFEPTLRRTLPYAWIIPREQSALLEPLRRHGVFVEQLTGAVSIRAERFAIDSVAHGARQFQGHFETALDGHWETLDALPVDSGSYVVRSTQPLAILALYLLEPESDDGFVTWNFLDAWLQPGRRYPIARALGPITATLRAAP